MADYKNVDTFETGQASVTELYGKNMVINYCLQNKIPKPVTDTLFREVFSKP